MPTNQYQICNEKKLEKAQAAFRKSGAGGMQVFADFDRTLTKVFKDGRECPSLISVLSRDNILDKEYAKEAEALYAQYRPAEISDALGYAEKSILMEEWWRKHYALLVRKRLNISDVRSAIASDIVELREGFFEFFNLLEQNSIPLVILSANGLGTISIRLFFERVGLPTENIHIVSNNLLWDDQGFLVGAEGPFIHSLNKKGIMIEKYPFYAAVKSRKNILLLGDTLEDADMAESFDEENLIRIGFLNKEVETQVKKYGKKYDALILHDGSFSFVNELLRGILGQGK